MVKFVQRISFITLVPFGLSVTKFCMVTHGGERRVSR